MGIRSNRCLSSAPLSYSGRERPKIQENQFKLNDSRQMVGTRTNSGIPGTETKEKSGS